MGEEMMYTYTRFKYIYPPSHPPSDPLELPLAPLGPRRSPVVVAAGVLGPLPAVPAAQPCLTHIDMSDVRRAPPASASCWRWTAAPAHVIQAHGPSPGAIIGRLAAWVWVGCDDRPPITLLCTQPIPSQPPSAVAATGKPCSCLPSCCLLLPPAADSYWQWARGSCWTSQPTHLLVSLTGFMPWPVAATSPPPSPPAQSDTAAQRHGHNAKASYMGASSPDGTGGAPPPPPPHLG